MWHPGRTAQLRLTANPGYWNARRGPRLAEVRLRNDLERARALELVCEAEREVDLLTGIRPEEAERVATSRHARLVAADEIRVLVGIIDRDADDLPLRDVRVRRALNLAVDRERLVDEAFHGYATPLAGLVPPSPLTLLQRAPDRLRPHAHAPERAAGLWRDAGIAPDQELRMAAPAHLEVAARRVAADLELALAVRVSMTLLDDDAQRDARRDLALRRRPRPWHVLLFEHVCQAVDSIPDELHRAFGGGDGEYRAGPSLPALQQQLDALTRQTSPTRQMLITSRIDRLVRDEALALFLCSPQKLYAVNQHVQFRPSATTFELADTEVTDGHWSVRG